MEARNSQNTRLAKKKGGYRISTTCWAFSLPQEAPWREASGRAPLLANPKYEVFERYANVL
jgi:hypothetical protein